MYDFAFDMLNKLSDYQTFHKTLTLADMLSLELRYRGLAKLTGREANNTWLKVHLKDVSETWTGQLTAAGV